MPCSNCVEPFLLHLEIALLVLLDYKTHFFPWQKMNDGTIQKRVTESIIMFEEFWMSLQRKLCNNDFQMENKN